MRSPYLLLLLIIALSAGCSRSSPSSSGRVVEPRIASPEANSEVSLAFDIAPIPQQSKQWLATYTSHGKTAKFRIELDPAKESSDTKIPMSFGKGRFRRETGSDGGQFLADLAKVLEASKLPKDVQRSDSLPFEYVILGLNQSRSSDDSFADSPRGAWTVIKIFFGDDQGEVFFNFSPAAGKAEFSIKDSDYGDFVVAELAKVL